MAFPDERLDIHVDGMPQDGVDESSPETRAIARQRRMRRPRG